MAGNHPEDPPKSLSFLGNYTGEGQTSPWANGSLICQLTRFSQGHRWGCLWIFELEYVLIFNYFLSFCTLGAPGTPLAV